MISKTKSLMLTITVLFAVVLVASLANAASLEDITNVVDPDTINHDQSSFAVTFDLTNTGAESDLVWSFSTSQGVIDDITFSHDFIGDGNNGDVTLSVTATVEFSEHQSGDISGTITVTPESGNPKDLDFQTEINDAAELSIDSSGTLSENSDATIVVTNDGNVQLDVDLIETSAFGLIFSDDSYNIAPGLNSGTVTVSLPLDVDLAFGNNAVTIRAEDASEGASDTLTLSVQRTFCSAGSQGGNLELSDIKIDNQGEGSDDEWQLLDTIEVEVQVDNNGDEDIDDIFVELALFDSNGNDQANDLEFDNADEEEFDVGRIRDGKDETITFLFRVPADFDDGGYKLAIKAYSDDEGENNECIDSSTDLSDDIFEKIDVDRETDEGKFIAFEDVVLTPSESTCGEVVTLTADMYNIGDEDQDQVRVNLHNSELGLNDFIEVRNDLDQGDKEAISFDFLIPSDAEDKTYQLRLSTAYDYKRGTYRESSDEDSVILLTVLGCSPSSGGNAAGNSGSIASIDAVLDSDVVSGEELVVRATITNLASESMNFVVDALSFESWASLESISNRVLNLNPGQSRDVTFTFIVDEDASGGESFIVDVSSGSESEVREIAVNIEGEAGTGSSGITGAAIGFGGDNAYLWIIGIVNVILVILIIVVAVRISRR